MNLSLINHNIKSAFKSRKFSYSAEFRQDVLKAYAKTRNATETAEIFTIDRKTVSRWVENFKAKALQKKLKKLETLKKKLRTLEKRVEALEKQLELLKIKKKKKKM